MNIRSSLIVSILILFFFRSYSQEKREYKKFYYPGGQLSSEGYMVNDQPEGFWKTYFPNGVVKSEGKRTNYLLDSTWVFYSENSDTLEKINYLNGKKSGYYFKYTSIQNKNEPRKNVVISKELYINDLKEGNSYYYYTSGKIKEITKYSKGKIVDESREYDENGNIITIYYYKNGTLKNIEKINRNDASGKKTGTWKEFYSDGRVKEERSYKAGVLEGISKMYDESGMLKSSVNYVGGNLDLKYSEENDSIEIKEETYPDGKLKKSGPYKNTTPIGLHKLFNQDGKLYYAIVYDNKGKIISEGGLNEGGKKEGKWIEYYSENKKKTEGYYKSGKRNGTWKYFFVNGSVEQEGIYRNDLYDGEWYWFSANGKVIKFEEFSFGKENGKYIEINELGDTIQKGLYAEGMKTGQWYEKTGLITFIGSYKDNMKDGVWKGYYDNGELYYNGKFVVGNPDEKHLYYSESGLVREIQLYSNGIKVGNWLRYDDQGQIRYVITYKNDEEYTINGIKIEKIGK